MKNPDESTDMLTEEQLGQIEAKASGAIYWGNFQEDIARLVAEVRRCHSLLARYEPQSPAADFYNTVHVEYGEAPVQVVEASYLESVDTYGRWPIHVAADPDEPIRTYEEAKAIAESMLKELGRIEP